MAFLSDQQLLRIQIVKPRACLITFAVFLLSCGNFASAFSSAAPTDETQWGTFRGQFLFEGSIPERRVLAKKGDPIKDAEVCSAKTQYARDLIIDKKSRGIANVVVYLKKIGPQQVHPNLKKPAKKSVQLTAKDCRFSPHVLFVRTGQDLNFEAKDPIFHNFHGYPIKNSPTNRVVSPRRETVARYSKSEACPFPVKCDFHAWMTAYILVLDHPYHAITGTDGRFKIEKLPIGQHEFTVWHERVGYLKRRWKVTVQPGEKSSPVTEKFSLKDLTRE